MSFPHYVDDVFNQFDCMDVQEKYIPLKHERIQVNNEPEGKYWT